MSALECPEGTVPGWLDETGEPTSCVENNPIVIVDPAPSPDGLAETGAGADALLLGGLLLLAGVVIVILARFALWARS